MAEAAAAEQAVDEGRPHASDGPRRTTLRLRLAVAFLAVAFAALVLLLSLVLALIPSDVARASRSQTAAIEHGFARAAATAYETGNRWSLQTLQPLATLADAYQAQVDLRRLDGGVVLHTSPPTGPGKLGVTTTLPVLVGSRKVATLTMRLASNGVATSDLSLQRSLLLAVAVGGGLAALVAVVASLLVAGHLVRPVKELTAAARSLRAGGWGARVAPRRGPREVDELGEAFNSLASSLEREDSLRRALTADIAHELRTPLAVLQVGIEALLDGVLPPDVESFQSLREEAVHLSHIVEDLEGLAEAQAAVLHLERHPVRLDTLAGEVLAEVGKLAGAEERRLSSELLPVVVSADDRRLRQVLSNLLSNAVKFTAPGDRIELFVHPRGEGAEIVVEDSGPGIRGEDLAHVFERFWRAPDADGTPGSGIGLAIVKELVEAHGGTITAESRLGEGSRFVLTLPASLHRISTPRRRRLDPGPPY